MAAPAPSAAPAAPAVGAAPLDPQTSSAQPTAPAMTLARLVAPIEALDALFVSWEAEPRGAVAAYRTAIEDLHREAVRRLIASLKNDGGALALLKESLGDEVVYGVLRHLGVLKPSLQEKIETALAGVRPMLASHGGDVELVRVKPPDTVEVRFLGACDGCAASQLTFVAGVTKAIQDACPEIQRVVEVRGLAALPTAGAGRAAGAAGATGGTGSAAAQGVGAGGGLVTLGGRSAAVGGAGANAANVPNAADVATVPNAASDIAIADPADRAEGPRAAGRVRFISPFALGTAGGADSADAVAAGWLPAAEMEEIPLGGVLRREIGGRDLLLSRTGDAILCFTNACAHLAMPLDEGAIADGVITCPFHGFQYLLESGECLTAPAVQLEQHAVRLIDNRVEIRLSR